MKHKRSLICFVVLINVGNLIFQAQVDKGRPGAGAGLEERLAWIDHSTNQHIAFAMVSLVLIGVVCAYYHFAQRNALVSNT